MRKIDEILTVLPPIPKVCIMLFIFKLSNIFENIPRFRDIIPQQFLRDPFRFRANFHFLRVFKVSIKNIRSRCASFQCLA